MQKTIFNQKVISPSEFNTMITKLRDFFSQKNYKEVYPQPIKSIMAACEDPKTLRAFMFDGNKWPLSQTNQMNLEMLLLSFPEESDGIHCLTTSYRDEPTPIEGRHDKIFPMFEFEHKGGYDILLKTLCELSVHLGLIPSVEDIPFFTYDFLCEKYGVEFLEAEHETKMWEEYGDVVAITHFPERTSPFWNMKQQGENPETKEKLFNKCDFIICGIETFGSAERESLIPQMRDSFHTISDGEYSSLLYQEFSKERVEEELENYLSLPMIERFGGGIGLTRLLRALKIKGII